MNKKWSLSVLLSCLLYYSITSFAAAIPHFKNPHILTVCSYSEFKPISYGNGQGYEADLVRAIAKRWEVGVKFNPQDIYEDIWLLPSKPNFSCDIAIGGITPSPYRQQQGAQFTVGNMFFDQSLLVRKKDYESGRITSYGSFKNTSLKIGVVPGTTGERYAMARAKENGLPSTVFVQYASESQLLPALLKGNIDAIARGSIGNEYQAEKNNNLITIAKKNYNEEFTFSVDPDNKELLEQINQAILVITDHNKIGYDQWDKNHTVFIDRVRNLQH
jgi:ABC-type amino acid transport substrate-binding protein